MPFEAWPCLPGPLLGPFRVPWEGWACHVGFACSDGHIRVILLTRTGSSMYLEIVLGSYIAIAVLGRSPHAGRACVGRRSGTRDHRFTCQRTQTTRAGEGSQMVTTSPLPSRGCSACATQKIADLDYRRVVDAANHHNPPGAAESAVFPAPAACNCLPAATGCPQLIRIRRSMTTQNERAPPQRGRRATSCT